MKTKNLHPRLWLYLGLTLSSTYTFALTEEWADSVKSKKQEKKKYTTTVVARTHSMGFFSYTGRLISDYPAADIFINVNHSNKWGLNLFKVADLRNSLSDNNFLMFLANKNFTVSKRVSINVYGGAILEQTNHFAGHGSDFVSNVTTTYKLNRHFAIDHTAMFGNMVLENKEADWVNRFRVLYASKHIDLTAWAWRNNKVLNDNTYTSVGLSGYYNRIPLSKRLSLGAGATGLMMISTSEPSRYPKKNGVLFTLAVTWH